MIEEKTGILGVLVGTHEVDFVFDGGTAFRGKDVGKAIDSVNNVIAPAIVN